MRILDDDAPGLGTTLPNITVFVDVIMILLVVSRLGAAGEDRYENDVRVPAVVKPDGKLAPSRQALLKVTVVAGREAGEVETYKVWGRACTLETVQAEIRRSKPGTVVVIVADKDARIEAATKVWDAANAAGRKPVIEVRKEVPR